MTRMTSAMHDPRHREARRWSFSRRDAGSCAPSPNERTSEIGRASGMKPQGDQSGGLPQTNALVWLSSLIEDE